MKKAEPDRELRLAEALRSNLRRRKAQARGVAGTPASPPVEPEQDAAAPESRT